MHSRVAPIVASTTHLITARTVSSLVRPRASPLLIAPLQARSQLLAGIAFISNAHSRANSTNMTTLSYPLAPSEPVDPVHGPSKTQKPINVKSNGSSHTNGTTALDAQHLKTAPLLPTDPLHGQIDNAAKFKLLARDFRSDTITAPTESMIAAMATASRGDDVYGEDLTTNSFQSEIALLTGKESAIFVPSGTLSNQLALRTHLKQPPHTVLCDTRSHIHRYEAGGIAFHCGASTEIVAPSNGHHLRWQEDILPNLNLSDDIHFSPTRIISLENTLNGTIFPQDEIVKISTEARKLGLIMHLDGARIWNVAAETGLSLKELCDPFDTVSLCLSKGLGAPIGSILVGPSAFIKKVRHFRKLYGAGVRQVGPLVAAARVGVVENYPKLQATHQLAKYAGRELEKLGVKLTAPVETSMVFLDTSSIDIAISELVARAAALPVPIKLGGGRMVVHYQIEKQAIDDLLELIKLMKAEKKNGCPTSAAAATGGAGLYSNSMSSGTAKGTTCTNGNSHARTSSIEKRGLVFETIGTSSGKPCDEMRHSVSLVLPFPDRSSALTLQQSISVDKELKPKEVRKEFTLLKPCSSNVMDEEHGKVELGVKIFATTVRQLRLSVNAFLEDAALICRTMSEFDPLKKSIGEAQMIQLEQELEEGSVGIAG
ncbi:related to GLY1 - L-threonine aldolase, low-specific [Melanopsichium pennsylvanicum]|uniref:Related to GLY1 - L-threonine aldolase, low-specific n=2 Tax=Melanopsichium pennsylvanicum TaxID=63383 RepID=A0AAJ4XSB2_9BASI|nr:related to GLY1-L-threonine aldolase, low-specific [Melanopsichium pennsylvanicum 4]SNX87625.1 related to GLY1 - L-threonine aldolase, low-specific [Melanopsichium pennsylvanicum]